MTTAIGSYATYALLKARNAIPDDTDQAVITTVCDQVNQYIETKTGRVLAPISSATYTLDGDGSNVLEYPLGIRALTVLELAYYTSGAYTTVPTTQVFLRPKLPLPGFPYTRLEFTDFPTQGFTCFPVGYDTVRLTMTTGFAAIPDDVIELALTAAQRAWYAVQNSQADIVGTDDMGRPLVSRFFSARDLETLRTYSIYLP